MKSGFVSIVGRPNVGKSTLLNSLLERKIAITSNVSGTTRNIIQGIYNDEDSQIVFIDTPGIHKPQNKLGTYLNKKAYMMTEDVDLLLFLVDVEKGFGKGDKFILEKIVLLLYFISKLFTSIIFPVLFFSGLIFRSSISSIFFKSFDFSSIAFSFRWVAEIERFISFAAR